MSHVLPLHLMSAGQEGRVVEVQGTAGFPIRLAEMGFRPGVAIRMLRAGTPCIVAVEETRMTFRYGDEVCVLVEVAANSALEAAPQC